MSIKKYFEVAENIQSLANKSAADIGSEVESVGYHAQDIIEEERFIPRIDFSKPENFARYGSAEEYYEQSIKRIYNTYPYDGSLKERLEWVNDSTYLDLHIYDHEYPRTTGYIIMSADGWGTGNIADGYGSSSSPEYIYMEGGPNPHPDTATPRSTQFTGSNYYEPSMNRGSNLEFNLASQGASVEFWLKKDTFLSPSLSPREVVFDLWNGENSSSADYSRLRLELTGNLSDGADPFLLTAMSGTAGFYRQAIATSTITSASVADGNWHHYAVTLKSASAGVTTKFYVDGTLNKESILGSTGINDMDSTSLRAYVGALITAVSGTTTPSTTGAGFGKLSGSLDEFRYWKTQRTSKDIGRYWFTQVGGGVNTDPEPFIETMESGNVDLGVYFKFNEGITGVTATDSVVLDYSGRFSNGAWTGYGSNSRNTGSAIISSSAAIKEFQDPIIYSFHPAVVALNSALKLSGSDHDTMNNASIYNSIPTWIVEEDIEGQKQLRYLTQIMSSYFDTLHLQIKSLNKLQDRQYVTGTTKPLPFAENLLASRGLVAPDLFLDADILEKLADRSEDKVYEKSLHDIKNTIYQNIYNNLSYIYKTKGTQKSFRNLIRCFGIDDELIKFNTYADNVQYELRSNRRNVAVADKFVNFNAKSNTDATVYNYADPTNANSVGVIPASAHLTGGYALTLETEVVFPLKLRPTDRGYVNTNTISASLFGMHSASLLASDAIWGTPDTLNFQVYAERDELSSDNVKFVLTSSAGGRITRLTSSLYQQVYNDTKWNLAVRIKPETYPLKGLVTSSNSNYIVELHGVEVDAGEVLTEFTISQSVTAPRAGFMTGSRRAYIGAHRTNFTGAVLQQSDVKINACRYWLDYLDNETLSAHALDTENYGALQPHLYAYEFNPSASFGDITKFDTLVFNWEFLTNTGSDANGQFAVADISSGSADFTRFGNLGNILNNQYTASGSFFAASSTSAIDKDFIVSSRLNLPENIHAEDMVTVKGTADTEVFTADSRPLHHYFAFEKSMYQTISEEMLNYFANLKDLHNLLGDPVEKYRLEYKQLNVMRRKFFEKVKNPELDFDKYYEFYKWFDSALSVLLSQLVPASADAAESVLTVVENHLLERPKYRRKFPFLQRIGGNETAIVTVDTVGESSENNSPDDFPSGLGISSNSTFTRRQIGSSNPPYSKAWKFFHAPVASTPLGTPPQTENTYWHRYAGQQETFKAVSVDLTSSGLAIAQTYTRRVSSPVRMSIEGGISFGGVGRHHNNRPNYVFAACAPYGPVVPSTNIPTNIMLGVGSDVEQLVDTTDIFFPTLKQRLGFALDPSINIDQERDLDGNVYAPFSLYSSSVTTGYNSNVVKKYKSGSMITNLHNDFVQNHDIPMQGPFPEKFVGGRYYRHTEVNDGTDTRESRAEGFRVELGSLTLPLTGTLGIVPPNYPFGDSPPGSAPLGWLASLPTAQRFRDETAKRPVNIRNILMTTASVGTRLSGTLDHNAIGNYQKNYQVINTGGRTTNDPFFQDQSYQFALNPQLPYSRLLDVRAVNNKAATIDDSGNYYEFDSFSAMNTNDKETWLFWMNCTNSGQDNYFLVGAVADDRYAYLDSTDRLIFHAYFDGNDGNWKTDDPVATDEWIHIAISYDGSSTSNHPEIYVNGTRVKISQTATPTGKLEEYDAKIRIGYHSSVGFEGYLSDIAFYNTNLNSNEIRQIYGNSTLNLATYGPLSAAANLLIWWRCGNGATDTADIIVDQMGNANLVAQGGSPTLIDIPTEVCFRATAPRSPFGDLVRHNFSLPNRSGANSNKTVIVNLFSSPGSYRTLSRGYLDPAHEELSAYNASPYRNRDVISYGMSGSASIDNVLNTAMRVVDQIDKPRGLNQLATLHCGQFGVDPAYGTYATIDQFPAWHKTNRNTKRRVVLSGDTYVTSSVYDNLFVQHAIPQSTQQYTWVTGSLKSGSMILDLQRPSCCSASTLSELVTSGTYGHSNFVGLRSLVLDPVSASAHILGFPLTSPAATVYYNSTLGLKGATLTNTADYLNVLLDNRGGAFGYSTWKQIRQGEKPVVRKLRETNQIGTVIAPKPIPDIVGGVQTGYITPTQPNTFIDYFEAPLSNNSSPIYFYFEDNTDDSNTANNLVLTVPFRNELDYFSNNGLNNRLGLQIDLDSRRAYNSVIDYTLLSPLSVVINYSERLYPSAKNAYKPAVRGRQNYTINNIWNNNRTKRSTTYGGLVGSMEKAPVSDSSIWPLDGHLNFTTTSSVRTADGAGELMNSYSRFSNSLGSGITSAPTYGMPIIAGHTGSAYPVIFGGAKWQAGDQAGKQPYENYSTYAEKIRLVGKDYSIVPEFRISTLMDTYVNSKESNFLAEIDNIFELTGAAIADSSEAGFFKTYTNADFLKYFNVIDEDLNEQRSGDLKIIRDKVALKCSASIKFLPYKGFYPAERTLELVSLFSASYLSGADDLNMHLGTAVSDQAHRALIEPLFSPGILYNTVKSGLGVSNFVLLNTGSYSVIGAAPSPITSLSPSTTILPEGVVRWSAGRILDIGSSSANDTFEGFSTAKVPFEALYKPKSFFTNENLINLSGRHGSFRSYTGIRATWGYIVDTGISGTTSWLSNPAPITNVPYIAGNLRTSIPLYSLAIDNFLCEVTNMFVEDLTSFTSAREEDFTPVTAGTVYTMRLDISRPIKKKSSTAREADTGSFDMYSRITGFGTPLNGKVGGGTNVPSFSHVTPPYYAGAGSVLLAFTASLNGIPTLDQILSGTNLYYTRDEYNDNEYAVADDATYDPRMMINDCYNLLESLVEVPPGTTTQKRRWLIQSKFETPVLNFASANYAVPPTASVYGTEDPPNRLINRGMWMQYGSIPTGSKAGVFTSLASEGSNSLLDVVKFTAESKRVGTVKSAFKLEEAIVAIPYRQSKNRRNFIRVAQNRRNSNTYRNMVEAMDKYVFPPKFDFTRFRTVDPVLMYIFEFSADLTQQDIADIWQNLPPNINEKFETKEAIVEEKQLVDLILNKDKDTHWMVFKVKKRAKKDFEKVRRSLLPDADLSAMPNAITSPYSYNWPYDYFSLVELAKINEQVQYVSTDLKQNTRMSEEEALDVQRTTNASRSPVGSTATAPSTPGAPVTSRGAQTAPVASRQAPAAPGAPQAQPAPSEGIATTQRATRSTTTTQRATRSTTTRNRGGNN